MGELTRLTPTAVWKHFENFCAIPRPSYHEEAAALYVMKEAERFGCSSRRDASGNVVVAVPATPGMADRPIVVLQGHLDMVPVAAPGLKHDFTRDPIQPYINGDYVKARGTTLGADNGIGCALGLGLMEDDTAEHGPLELLFTVNEEAGMDGAHGLESDFVKGRILINPDTEAWGEICISCAGGGDVVIRLPVEREDAIDGCVQIHIRLSGLRGGHSGLNINDGHGNANKILARCLVAGREASTVRLISLSGGTKRNAIADGAKATVQVPTGQQASFRSAVDRTMATIARELAGTDPGMTVEMDTIGPGEERLRPMTRESTDSAINFLIALPHGVLAMSREIPGLVETSVNMGVLESTEKMVTVVVSARSAVNSQLEAALQQIRAIGHFAGCEIEESGGYPGWKPDKDSPLLKTAVKVFKALHGAEPQIKAVHAGLECGLFSEKLRGVDMISFGPTIQHAHSPAEQVYHPSVAWVYEFIKEILKEIAFSLGASRQRHQRVSH